MKHYFPVLLLPCDEPKDNPIEAHKILTLVILLVMTCLSQFLAFGKISNTLARLRKDFGKRRPEITLARLPCNKMSFNFCFQK